MAEEPWEALDVDDSDLPSILRPCHRRRDTSTSAAVDCIPSQSSSIQPEEENLIQPQVRRSLLHRAIPGPAGAVQAAMFRRNLDRENRTVVQFRESDKDFNGGDPVNDGMSTQEYLQRAVETADFDDDFTRQPWISALQYIGLNYSTISSTPINCLTKCLNTGKASLVIAIVKSCAPNGLGGLFILLKDPTGTVGASVHHKVLCETEFGKRLGVGTIVILLEVAIFAPGRSVHYLNITRRNLVKMFSQDDASTSEIDNFIAPIATERLHQPENVPSRHSTDESREMVKTSSGKGVEIGGEREVEKSSNDQVHRRGKASMAQWTDEQLDELFVDNDDDIFS